MYSSVGLPMDCQSKYSIVQYDKKIMYPEEILLL